MSKIRPESNIETKTAAEEEAEKEVEEAEVIKGLKCHQLFRYASCCDIVNYVVGIFFAVLAALSGPFWAIILGELVHMGFMV